MNPLSGTQALVTGASRGIGRAVARALAVAGAEVYAVARGLAGLESLVAEVQALAPGAEARVHALACDLRQAQDVQRLLVPVLETVAQRPTLLINNAGVFPLAPIVDTTPEVFADTIDSNLVAPFRVLHTLLRPMRESGRGHVVTIGSVADRRTFGGNSAYAASKFGARALHEVLREELVGTGVRATLVAPSATDTPIWDPIDPDNTPGLPPRAAMLRPDDVADAVLWAVTRPAHLNIDEVRLSRA
ncbi:SDR family oxidoreductase [Gemmatimonas sp. UBA7669]|uniref:SDR family oxidoreductase n=1 Tax=Gemmatimonas sp. UBA7669 TaxID=1946568 RepID=UPI0025B9ED0C|nr:SDR family NAD(P)-dependent oxidoreductase [Gemmatimonas sp. UBA7669]